MIVFPLETRNKPIKMSKDKTFQERLKTLFKKKDIGKQPKILHSCSFFSDFFSPLLTEPRIRADRRYPARLEQGLCHEHPRENDEGPLSPPIQARTCTLSRPVNPFSHTLRSRTVWRNCGTASRTCSCGSTPPRCDTPLSLSFSK